MIRLPSLGRMPMLHITRMRGQSTSPGSLQRLSLLFPDQMNPVVFVAWETSAVSHLKRCCVKTVNGKALYFAGGAGASVVVASQANAPLTLYLSKNLLFSPCLNFILPQPTF